jgi:hypothetical protein
MGPKTLQPTTDAQQKHVMQWLSNDDNRLSVFGGAGAKSAYGGKNVVKPATAYNSLAQSVNAKFGTQWDGDSAKARLRTMRTKFHTVFTLCAGRVQEESENWKLESADKSKGILTLADKAQDMCPHWNLWLEWCGNDPNMAKHGTSDSNLALDQPVAKEDGEDDGVGRELSEDAAADDGVVTAGSAAPASYGTFSKFRAAGGDNGFEGNDDGDVPRAVAARVDTAKGGVDDLQEQKRKRHEMLKGMTKDEKAEFYRQEGKEKRQKEQDDSNERRSAVASAAQSGAIPSSPSVSSGSPFGKGGSGGSSDWQANFLAQRQRDEDLKQQRQDAASVTVVKLQIDAADRQSALELQHKQQMLNLQTMQFQAQQQQTQMQMQFQQQQHMLYVLFIP